jgi:thiol-disulfide isomerase/thioredoxin
MSSFPGNRALVLAVAAALGVALLASGVLLTGEPAAPPGSGNPDASAPAGVPTSGGAPVDRFAPVEPAGNFTLVAPLNPDGTPADMAAYRGKALLVNFWATWCAPCIEELPALGKLQAMLGGADFAVVTIALDEPDAAKIAPFLAAHGAGNLPALLDGNRSVDKVMAVSALPTTLLIDADGMVRASLTGDAQWDCGAALAAVKAFIADGGVSTAKLERCQ